MEFFKNEKYAILKCLDAVCRSSSNVHKEEMTFFINVLKDFNITIDEGAEGTENIDLVSASKVLNSMSKEKRKYASDLILKLSILGDGLNMQKISLVSTLSKIID